MMVTFLIEETDMEDNTRAAELLLEDLDKSASSDPNKKYNLLADLTPIGNPNYATGKSRKLFADTSVFQKFSRIAVVSTSLIIKTLVISLPSLTGKYKNVKWFDNKEKAREWLGSPNS